MIPIVAARKKYELLLNKKTKPTSRITFPKRELHRTLKREPIDENFEDLDDSSANGGNKHDTKEHLEALKSAWCSATT